MKKPAMRPLKPIHSLPPQLIKNKGKGGGQEMLPSRHAVSQLVGGDPVQRSMSNYAKLTPSGAGGPSSYGDIIAMDENNPAMPPAPGS